MRKTILLLLLSGLGTGCAYAAFGVALFARVPDAGILAWVFFAFGTAGGLFCTVLRLGAQHVSAQAAAAAARPALAQSPSPTATAAAAEPMLAPVMSPPATTVIAPPLVPAAATAPRAAGPRGLPVAGFASSAFGAL